MDFLNDKTAQNSLLFASSYRDLIEPSDEIWNYIKFFSDLDLSDFKAKYSGEGQSPIDPMLMVRTIFYGLKKGIVSVRKLAEACRFDLRFIVLSGSLTPDRRTFDRFFIRHEKSLEVFFKQIVEKAMKSGLVDLNNVAIDGTRLKGHTQAFGHTFDNMNRAKEHIAKNLEKLKSDLESERKEEKRSEIVSEMAREMRRSEKMDKAIEQIKLEDKNLLESSKSRNPIGNRKKSLNDPEALELAFKNNTRASMFGYNAQIAADEKAQIVVGCLLHDKASDYEALTPVMNKIEETTGSKPVALLCDVGYTSQANICKTYDAEIKPIFAAQTMFDYSEIGQPEAFTQLNYNQETNRYTCLAGHPLTYSQRDRFGKSAVKRPRHCGNCEISSSCGFYKKGKPVLTLPNPQNFERMKIHSEITRTEKYKEQYRLRKKIVEPVFGNIKHNKRFMLSVTTRSRVATRFLCMCIAHNIEKIVGGTIVPTCQNALAVLKLIFRVVLVQIIELQKQASIIIWDLSPKF